LRLIAPQLHSQMTIDPLLFAELFALGLLIGYFAGLLGIGGGMLMVPFMVFVLSSQGVAEAVLLKVAVATSLTTICFTSLSSVWAHHRKGAVLWPVALVLAPGILIGSLAGANLAVALPAKALTFFFAAFVTFSATQMLLNKKPKPGRVLPGSIGMFGVGSVIGVLSSMVGAGGAFVSVPFMTWCNVSIHNAVATSAALGFPIALANVAGYIVSGQNVQNLPDYTFGYLWLPALVVIAVCSVLMAPIGASTAHKLPVKQLKRVFASVLYLLAAYMLYKGLSA
jgi:uncharacterized protein